MSDTNIYIDYLSAKAQFRLEMQRSETKKGELLSPEEAVKWYKKLSREGNHYAELELGKCYENGYGIRKNCRHAADYYRDAKTMAICNRAKYSDTVYEESEKIIRAAAVCIMDDDDNAEALEEYENERFEFYYNLAESGDADVQNKLGDCYFHGIGVEKDFDEAFYWWKESAEQGNAKGQYSLAHCYQYGQGVEKNFQEALYWYYESANQGYDAAQDKLGVFYYDGNGVKKSYKEAAKWFRKSAEETFNWVEMMEL